MDYLGDSERTGEAILGLGLIAGGIRGAWRYFFPKNGTGAPPLKASLDTLTCQVSTLSAKLESVDGKVDQLSETVAGLAGKFEGYLEGIHQKRP